MSKTLRWILGILAAIVVIAVVAAAVFVLWNHAPLRLGYRLNQAGPNAPVAPSTPGAPNTQPNQPYGFRPYRAFPYGGFERRLPMMGGPRVFGFGGMMPFGMGIFFLGGLLRLLIPLIIVVLVAIVFYQLGKRAGAAPAPVAPPPPPVPTELPTPPPGRKVAKG